MSTKSMPGIGKSGNCRRAARRLIFVLASSEALAAEVVDWDSSLVALSVVADVLADGATRGCCVGIVEKEEKEREERRGEVGSHWSDMQLMKFLLLGRRRVRWVGLLFGLYWRTTALIVNYPYSEQGKGWKEQIR